MFAAIRNDWDGRYTDGKAERIAAGISTVPRQGEEGGGISSPLDTWELDVRKLENRGESTLLSNNSSPCIDRG